MTTLIEQAVPRQTYKVYITESPEAVWKMAGAC